MITRARANAAALGYDNVTFRQGDIEQMPVEDNVADVVVSNCVLNLVPDKRNVMKEIARVLKPDGHFSISDVVLSGALPEKLKKVAELYAGCVSGAVQREQIVLPDEILRNYLTEEEINEFRSSGTGIVSITVFARKLAL
jgi:ubiquinone/menaquinone biosynthesis C-methylase UbiE